MSGHAVDAETAIERIQQRPGVTGFVICGEETVGEDGENHFEIHRRGQNIPKELAQQYGDKFSRLSLLARSIVRDLEPENELLFFRVRAKRQEIIVAPKYKEGVNTPKFNIVTIQTLPQGSA